MIKKSFKHSPALNFITMGKNVNYTDSTDNINNTDNTSSLPKKTFVLKNERKTYRINLLLKPSILKNIKKIAYIKQTSVNDIINHILEEHNKIEDVLIKKYDEIFFNKKQ